MRIQMEEGSKRAMDGQQKVKEVWVFVCKDVDGTEGVPAITGGAYGEVVPMLAADVARVQALKPFALQIAQSGRPVKLMRFWAGTTEEVYKPDGTVASWEDDFDCMDLVLAELNDANNALRERFQALRDHIRHARKVVDTELEAHRQLIKQFKSAALQDLANKENGDD